MKRFAQLFVSLFITVVGMWWTFKDTDSAALWASLRTANYLWLIPYFAILTVIHLLRTWRWGLLLSGIERVPFKKLNEASAIGMMMLTVLPFRLGEFARPVLIAQRSNIRRSAAMTSVVLERIVDGIFIAALLRLLLFFIPRDTPQLSHLQWGANLMFAVFAGGLAFLLFATWQRERSVRLLQSLVGTISPRLASKMSGIVDAFVGAMHQLPGPASLVAFLGSTVLIWMATALGMSVLSYSFALNLSWFQAMVVMSFLVVGLMIPAAPGSAGTFQSFVKVGLAVFLSKELLHAEGVAYANVLWGLQIIQQVAFGLLFLALSHQSFGDLASKLEDAQAAEDQETPKPAQASLD